MNISRHAYAISGLVMILTAASLATSRGHANAVAGSAPVTVKNTAVDPVPVTGSVTASVSGTIAATQSGAWNVGQSGAWSVGQSGTWNVAVPDPVTIQTGTTPLAVTDSSTTSRTPTEIDLSATFSDGNSASGPLASYTVPSGKRLVLQYVSAFGGIQSGQHLLECDLNDLIFIPFVDGGNDSATEYFSCSQPVTFAFNGGTVISIDATRAGTSNGGLVQVHGFGYLEPM